MPRNGDAVFTAPLAVAHLTIGGHTPLGQSVG
jgi:hypothetical protein